MASLHHRPGSPFWWGKFRDGSGTIRFRSTKQKKRTAALEVVLCWERAGEAARRGELTKAVVLKTLNEVLERATGERLEVTTARKFFSEWLNGKKLTGKSPGTSGRYRPVVDGFLRLLGEKRAEASIAGVTATDVERYRDAEIASGKSPSSANLALKILSAALNEAKRKGLILANPALAVELLHAPGHERQPFTDEQIAKLLAIADSEWKGMILLGAHVGCRIGDAAKLLWAAVDLAAGTLTFAAQKTNRLRHGKPQVVALHPELQAYFKELRSDEPNAPVFPTLQSKSAGGHQGLSNAFATLIDKAKLERVTTTKAGEKGRSFNGLSFHSLRHTFVSRLANASVTADVRKEIVGHSSDNVHRR